MDYIIEFLYLELQIYISQEHKTWGPRGGGVEWPGIISRQQREPVVFHHSSIQSRWYEMTDPASTTLMLATVPLVAKVDTDNWETSIIDIHCHVK